MRPAGVLLALACLGSSAASAAAQAPNMIGRPADIEHKLLTEPLQVVSETGSRFKNDRTDRATIRLEDSTLMMVKLAPALPGADTFNNRPRYELAAYVLQKLFLDPDDYVVPPTVVRCFPLDQYRKRDPKAQQTFNQADCVLVEMQYWLWNVHIAEPYDKKLFKADSVYARHMSDFNVFTYLVHHLDSNLGNYLVSDDSTGRRVFSVDNGLAFRSEPGNRGEKWKDYRLDAIDARTVHALEALTPEKLEQALSVLVQFERRDGTLQPMPPGPCLDHDLGVRDKDGVVQLGLTDREIDGVADRVQHLVDDIQKGKLRVF